jgi:hypothetical protein
MCKKREDLKFKALIAKKVDRLARCPNCAIRFKPIRGKLQECGWCGEIFLMERKYDGSIVSLEKGAERKRGQAAKVH